MFTWDFERLRRFNLNATTKAYLKELYANKQYDKLKTELNNYGVLPVTSGCGSCGTTFFEHWDELIRLQILD
jgi:hypothetical protein